MKFPILSIAGTLLLLTSNLILAQDDEFHLDEVYSINPEGTINLSSDDADIFIIGTDRSDVHVKIDRVVETKGLSWGDRHFDVEIEERNGDLHIRDKEWGNQSGFMGYSREEYVIRIEAPGSVSLNLKGDDDDYEISNFRGKIRMRIDDGNIRLENCLAESYDFDVDDSDIVLRGASGELVAILDDGDLSVYDGALSGIDIRGDDSDFDIETILTDNGEYRFRFDDSSLDFNVLGGGGSFEIYHDDGRISYDNGFIQEEDDDEYSRYKLEGGKARIRISGDDLSVRLNSFTTN